MKNLTIWLRWVSMCGLPFLPTTGTCTPLLIMVIKYPTCVGISPIVKLSTQALPVPQDTALSAQGEISRLFPQRLRIHKGPDISRPAETPAFLRL